MAEPQQEMSDDDVFGKPAPHEMSDADVFGQPEPAPEPLNMKGFKQRLSDLWERGRIDPEMAMANSPELRMGGSPVGKAFKEGFQTGFGEEEIGLSEEQIQQIKDLGLGPGGSAAYGYLAQQYKYGAVLFRGMSGVFRGVQEAAVAAGVPRDIAAIPDALMGSPHPTGVPHAEVPFGGAPYHYPSPLGEYWFPKPLKPTEAATISRIVADRDGTPRVQHIGELPTQQDFKSGADVLSRPDTARADALRYSGKSAAAPEVAKSDVAGRYKTAAGKTIEILDAENGQFQIQTKITLSPPGTRAFIDRVLSAEGATKIELAQEAQPPRAAPSLVEENLRKMWDERGIHPAEVVHDAQSDALLRHDVAPPSFEAYHGSPSDIAEFDVSKTSEGIQLGSAERAAGYTHGQGALYKVIVRAPMESFIDRGMPIEQQSGSVQAAIAGIKVDLGLVLPEGATGGDFYFALSKKLAGDDPHLSGIQKANELLRDRNVPGINDGGENFTVFDDKLLQITEKNGVPFKPTVTAPVQNTPMPQGTPRSELARTGDAHIDAILDDPVTKRNIDNPVINDQYDVPYSAGGSTPMHDPTMYIDRHFPRSMEVDGVRFDPAEPFTIHENVEQHVMEALIKGGMEDVKPGYVRLYRAEGPSDRPGMYLTSDLSQAHTFARLKSDRKVYYVDVPKSVAESLPRDPRTFYAATPEILATKQLYIGMDKQTAYKVAHFEFAEKAEGAWYRAHGIDQAKAEEAYRPYIDQIQHENVENPPPNLYEDPYPHDDVRAAKGEPLAEPGPTKAEIAQAKTILAQEGKPRSVQPNERFTFELNDQSGDQKYLTMNISSKEGKSAGNISFVESPETVQVIKSELEDEFRGKGLGTESYKNLIQYALDKGKTFESDKQVSVSAAKVYDRLEKDGFTVERKKKTGPHEDEFGDFGGEDFFESDDGGPVFRVTGGPKAEIARAKEILAQEPKPTPGGADVTRDMPDTPLSVEPASPPGRSAGAAGGLLDQLNGFAQNIQYMFDPMATGSNRAMVIAKDAISMVRRIRWDHLRIDRDLVERFEPEQRKAMWDRADEESVALQLGESREHLGLATLEPEERALVESLHERAQSAWLLARDAGIVEGDGLPAYTPRMVLNVASATDALGPRALNELGRNVFTRTAQLKRRGHMTAEETEAAAKELVGQRMAERGASMAEITAAQEKVAIARDIRALALATARLEEASVWRTMINEIEMAGKSAGEPTVAVGFKPGNDWFTIAGNPAFTKWEPLLEKVQDVAGQPYWQPVLNNAGEPIFQQKPLYMHKDFKGPMTAILDPGESQSKLVQGSQSAYGALMALKGKSMTVILNSPIIHNAVVWSKVAEAAGLREWMGFGLYWRGNRIVNNPGRAGELIERGLQPMGPRGGFQDITSMMEHPDITREHPPSWTGKVAAAILVPERLAPQTDWMATRSAADAAAVERGIGKLGNFVHNTLLWDRVRDVQFGLADFLSDKLVAEGKDRLTADRIAAHFSNMVVGSIPKEAMSAAARATANVAMFSRSFTLGNLAVYKQAVTGLPKPILAQIERDFGIRVPEGAAPEDVAAAMADIKKGAQWTARKKALSTLALSAGFFYVGNAVMQHAFNILSRDETVDEEIKNYARRFADLMADTSEDPFELRHMIGRLSPTYDNEPAKEDRFHIGYAKDGTAIYGRSPVGKYGEEVLGYPTKPMAMVRSKLNPTVSGLLEILENDKGFGRKIYDENDTSLGGDAKTAFAVAKHMVMRHLPEQQIMGAVDLLRGEGDTKVNMFRAFGPVVGFTASVGAPGGQARGEQLAAKQQFDARFNLAWPDIRKQVLRGDSDGAREALTGLGVPPRMQEGLIRNALNPSGALRGGTLRNFMQYSTPQQRERFERAQGRGGPPVPPEMPQIEAPQ